MKSNFKLKTLIVVLFTLSLFAISSNVIAKEKENADPYIVLPDGTKHFLHGVDESLIGESLNVFTPEYGDATHPFDETTAQAIVVNNIVVELNDDSMSGTTIPTNGYVLSGSGKYKQTLSELSVGDVIGLENVEVETYPDKYFVLDNTVYPVDHINGGRGAGDIVIYNDSYSSHTDTNVWGVELAIDENKKVIDIRRIGDVKNLEIPKNGVVASIQSESEYVHLLDNVKIGDLAEVVLDNRYFYNVTRIAYNAFNPQVKSDNPDGWDTVNDQPYAGFRGANQVIVYDSSYGEKTGTNSFGYEFIADSNALIIKSGGNDNAIPEGGLVVSGHGEAVAKLTAAGSLSSTVIIKKDDKEVVVISTPKSIINRSELMLVQERERLEQAVKTYKDIDYDSVETYLNAADKYLKQANNLLYSKNYSDMLEETDKLEMAVNDAYFTNFESRNVEMRAVWMRPKETTRNEVKETLETLKDSGVNAIYLETSYGDHTIYKSSSPYVNLNPNFKGQDMLQMYIEEAHVLGIEIHAWYKVFAIEPSVTRSVPEWAMETRSGEKIEPITGFSWISPANEEAREYVKLLVNELVENYDVDGFQLDYIRYPDADMGYEKESVEPFILEYGINPIDLDPKDPKWLDWAKYREELVNTMVYELIEGIRDINPDIVTSASVWPQYNRGAIEKMQNPQDWVDKNYIDILFPMSYNIDITDTINDLNNSVDLVKDNAYLVFGVGSYLDISPKDLINQLDAVKYQSEGTGVFESSSFLKEGYSDKASQGIYSRSSVIPWDNFNLSVEMILKDINRKIEDIYLPLGGMDHRSANPIQAQLDNLIKKSDDDIYKVNKRLDQVLKKIQKDDKINSFVIERITKDIIYLKSIINKSTNW